MSIPWTMIIELGIKIIMWVLGRNEEVKEAKRKFYEFVDHMDSTIPLRLKEDARRQIIIIREQRRQEEHKQKQEHDMHIEYKRLYEEAEHYKLLYEQEVKRQQDAVRNRVDD